MSKEKLWIIRTEQTRTLSFSRKKLSIRIEHKTVTWTLSHFILTEKIQEDLLIRGSPNSRFIFWDHNLLKFAIVNLLIRRVLGHPNNKERLSVCHSVRTCNSKTTGPILMKLYMRYLHTMGMTRKLKCTNFLKKKFQNFPDFFSSWKATERSPSASFY